MNFKRGCCSDGHGCHLFKWPSTRQEWWRAKITRTAEIDRQHLVALDDLGWRVAIVWECALRGKTRLDFDEVVGTLVAWLRSGETSRLEIAGTDAASSGVG